MRDSGECLPVVPFPIPRVSHRVIKVARTLRTSTGSCPSSQARCQGAALSAGGHAPLTAGARPIRVVAD